MALFAQVFRVGQVEHDLLQAIGLTLAALLLGALAFRYVRSDAARRPRLVATLALVALFAVGWTGVETWVRLCAALADMWSRSP